MTINSCMMFQFSIFYLCVQVLCKRLKRKIEIERELNEGVCILWKLINACKIILKISGVSIISKFQIRVYPDYRETTVFLFLKYFETIVC